VNTLKSIAAATLLSCAPAFASAATELVSNGGFETGDLSGWTCLDANYCEATTGTPHSGTYSLQGYDNVGFATLSQTIATTTGASYDFSAWVYSNYDNPANIFGYSLDGGATTSLGTSTVYTQILDTFVASGTSAVISLFFETDGGTGTIRIDDISVVQTAAVPVPAALPMLLLGLGGLGVAARRKKAA